MNAIHDRYDAQDVILLITRGKISDEDNAKSEIKMLQKRNVSFITIAVGSHSQYTKDYLVDIFSKYKGLKDNVHNVLDQICLKNVSNIKPGSKCKSAPQPALDKGGGFVLTLLCILYCYRGDRLETLHLPFVNKKCLFLLHQTTFIVMDRYKYLDEKFINICL